MGLSKELRLLLKGGNPSATIVEEEKTDASTQVLVQKQDSETQTNNYTDELESMSTYYEQLIQEKDEVIKELDNGKWIQSKCKLDCWKDARIGRRGSTKCVYC
jgi:capsular polysaccharide biosynthesis protein